MFIKLIQLTKKLIEILHRPNTDVTWSRWDTPQEAIQYMQNLLMQLENGEINAVRELKFLFGPTASLQEIAMSSGWGNEYFDLSSESDILIAEILYE